MRGILEAFDEFDAVERIRESCDVVLNIREVKPQKEGILNKEIGPKLNTKAFTIMCSQFAIILKAGVPAARTCGLIAEKTSDKKLKKILSQVAKDAESGRSLSDAFEERGRDVLPTTFIETIRAGEESGNMDKAFETMYLHFDKQMKMRNKVRTSLMYPGFVIAVAIVVVIILMVKVVPVFTEVFAGYGSELPLVTKILIGISNFCARFVWIFLILVIAAVLVFKLYTSTEKGRLKKGQLAMKLPVLGNISTLNAASQFANTMTTMLGAGLTLTKAISITARVLDNYYIGHEVGKMSGRIETGKTLGECMRESSVMPDILVDMVAVGEETGELEETMDKVALYYDAELEMAITKAINRLEPITLVFVGGIAGFIVVAIYIAMFQMYNIM